MEEQFCQICGIDLLFSDEGIELDNLPYEMTPSATRTCSFKCHLKAERARGGFMLKDHLKNWVNLPFETWNAIFEFPTAGGYAEKRYQMFRTQPIQFLMTLDTQNVIKLVLGNRE